MLSRAAPTALLCLSLPFPCAGSVQFWGSKQQPELVRSPVCCQHALRLCCAPAVACCAVLTCAQAQGFSLAWGSCTLSCGGADGLGPLGLLGGVSISHSKASDPGVRA